MPQCIELFFDEPSNRQIRAMWEVLAVVSGSSYVLKNGVHPHVALAVFDSLPETGPLIERLQRLAAILPAAALQTTGADAFPGDAGVVYLGFEKSRYLQSLHSQMASLIESFQRANHAYYQAQHWLPHCTLAQQVRPAHAAETIKSAKAIFWPATVQTAHLALIDYPPTRVLWSAPLARAEA